MPRWLRRELNYLDPQVRLLMVMYVSVAMGILVAAGLSGPPGVVSSYAMAGFGTLLGAMLAVLLASLRADLLASSVQLVEAEGDSQDEDERGRRRIGAASEVNSKEGEKR